MLRLFIKNPFCSKIAIVFNNFFIMLSEYVGIPYKLYDLIHIVPNYMKTFLNKTWKRAFSANNMI